MPKAISDSLTEIGGKKTEFGQAEFLRKAAEIRRKIVGNPQKFRDITREVQSSEYSGTLSKPAAGYAAKNRKRKGTKMPKATASNLSVTVVAGKRGRKAEFDHNDFALNIGANFDVTEEMQSNIPSEISEADGFNSEAFLAEMFNMETRNESVSNFRKNRQSALKRAAVKKNGEKSRYSFAIGAEKGQPVSWIMIREKDGK